MKANLNFNSENDNMKCFYHKNKEYQSFQSDQVHFTQLSTLYWPEPTGRN